MYDMFLVIVKLKDSYIFNDLYIFIYFFFRLIDKLQVLFFVGKFFQEEDFFVSLIYYELRNFRGSVFIKQVNFILYNCGYVKVFICEFFCLIYLKQSYIYSNIKILQLKKKNLSIWFFSGYEENINYFSNMFFIK